MGDDGIAIEIAKNIQGFLKKNNIEVIIGETDFEYCLSNIKKDDFLFILDAGYYGKKIGDITTLSLDNYTSHKKGYTQHSYSFIDLVKLYYKETKGYILAIEVSNIDYTLEISKELKANMNKISNEIISIIIKEIKSLDKSSVF
ncbi:MULTISPECIES: hydrogenase maturation protease [Clostridium]|nr:hydrogenase maturation protease [Clostridium sporogenes]AJD29539.1 hydrogenase maturation protease family protein [Clostridium botulinum Prevot_594]EHN14823.1 hydrogenase maturation protease [Clostridium sporogenes PA 3679]STC78476.1 hydrogenase maturation protease [Clostridium botulinum]AKC62549.1 hydrogenase maturation protease [Clostridium sporogenes]AKJ89808.1 hydrogenase maturation protease [Clostridium sporogenes]